jgi:integrase
MEQATHWEYAGGFITKNERGTFSVHVGLGHGKRRRTTTKTLAEAKAWILAGDSGETAPDRLMVEDAIRARKLLPQSVTLEEAARFWKNEHKGEIETVRIEEAWERYAEEVRPLLRSRTFDSYRSVKSMLVASCGDMAVESLSESDMQRLLANRSTTARNFILRSLSPFLEYCVTHGLCRRNVTKSVRKARIPKTVPKVLSLAEVERLLKIASGHPSVVPYFVLGLFAGLRPDEARRVRESNFLNGFILLDGNLTKTADARSIPVRPNLAAWLEAFPIPAAYSERHIRAVRAEFGEWSQDVARHSFASYLYEMSQNKHAVAAEMGHQGTEMLFTHYRALVPPGSGVKYFGIMPTMLK